jgi:hypothetical protein
MARAGLERQIALLHLFTTFSRGSSDDFRANSLCAQLRRRGTHVRDRWILVAVSLGIRS